MSAAAAAAPPASPARRRLGAAVPRRRRCLGPHLWLAGAAVACLCCGRGQAQSFFEECGAQPANVDAPRDLANGVPAVREIAKNATHRWTYTNYNMTTMEQDDASRKIIVSLEPCYGIVYLFVRKNVPCHPDPYSCIDLDTGERDSSLCARTHFMSEIDGSKDGAPTFFQISLSATKYYFSVFAASDAQYTLTVLDDVGAWPRRGNNGLISAAVADNNKVMLQWATADYFPVGISETWVYHVYAVRLAPNDNITSPSIFLRPGKILNTVCGIENNTDYPDLTLDAALCDTMCNTTLSGLLSGSTYAFNVVAESHRRFRMAYSGATLQTSWSVVEAVDVAGGGRRLLESAAVPMDSQDLQVAGAVLGSVMGMVGMAGLVLLRFTT